MATAHPHYDNEGNTYNMGTAIMGMGLPKYVIFKVPADASGKACSVLKIKKHKDVWAPGAFTRILERNFAFEMINIEPEVQNSTCLSQTL